MMNETKDGISHYIPNCTPFLAFIDRNIPEFLTPLLSIPTLRRHSNYCLPSLYKSCVPRFCLVYQTSFNEWIVLIHRIPTLHWPSIIIKSVYLANVKNCQDKHEFSRYFRQAVIWETCTNETLVVYFLL